MAHNTHVKRAASATMWSLVLLLAACGGRNEVTIGTIDDDVPADIARERGTTVQEAFFNRRNEERIVQVNRYIWTASLQVLDFLPIQSVDPYTGVIITGFGTPPGGGRAYRATVLIQDPALDARSLNVALLTQRGPADAATVRAVEDAILTRARQLRIADGGR